MNGGRAAVNQELGLKPHVCSYCDRSFSTLQSLGGHLTRHRREMAEMRRQHDVFMEGQRQLRGIDDVHGSPRSEGRGENKSCGVPMVPLTPNYAFWEAYRRVGQQPKVVNFVQIPSASAGEQPEQPILVVDSDDSLDEIVSTPSVRPVGQVEQEEEVNTGDLDLTLRL